MVQALIFSFLLLFIAVLCDKSRIKLLLYIYHLFLDEFPFVLVEKNLLGLNAVTWLSFELLLDGLYILTVLILFFFYLTVKELHFLLEFIDFLLEVFGLLSLLHINFFKLLPHQFLVVLHFVEDLLIIFHSVICEGWSMVRQYCLLCFR